MRLLSGAFTREALLSRIGGMTHAPKFVDGLVGRLLEEFGEGSRPSVKALSAWLSEDKKLRKRLRKGAVYPENMQIPAVMAPDMRAAAGWRVPAITTTGNLAHWLDLDFLELDWFSGGYGVVQTHSKLSHYHLRSLKKSSGGLRLLEVPKWRLKQVQRTVLHGIIDHIPAHPCSHGFQKKRSIMTYVKPHVGRRIVMKMDLQNYFLTIEYARVRALFHLAGYPPSVSRYLAGLCTHAVHPDAFQKGGGFAKGVSEVWRYQAAHLPQGAPSSPAIADRLLFRLDLRLHGLAKSMGMHYSRYADDMAFSSDDRAVGSKRMESVIRSVTAITSEEGFYINEHKTRVMRASQRQRLAGLVVNDVINVERSEYDLLRAILHRCVKNGLDAENRHGHPSFYQHLVGRVEFVRSTNPRRGEKLRFLLDDVKE